MSDLKHERLTHALEGLWNSDEDDNVAQKGTLAAIRLAEKLDVFLARGRHRLTVDVCGALEGRFDFHGLSRACEQAKHFTIGVEFPAVVTNRIAHARASPPKRQAAHKQQYCSSTRWKK